MFSLWAKFPSNAWTTTKSWRISKWSTAQRVEAFVIATLAAKLRVARAQKSQHDTHKPRRLTVVLQTPCWLYIQSIAVRRASFMALLFNAYWNQRESGIDTTAAISMPSQPATPAILHTKAEGKKDLQISSTRTCSAKRVMVCPKSKSRMVLIEHGDTISDVARLNKVLDTISCCWARDLRLIIIVIIYQLVISNQTNHRDQQSYLWSLVISNHISDQNV